VATAKVFLWEFVELAFLAVLALILLSILLGKDAGGYVTSVAENASKFASSASSGLLGIVLILAIIYLAMRRIKPERGSRTRGSDAA
jgi:membrane protein DedA with SNARE-associated domain